MFKKIVILLKKNLNIHSNLIDNIRKMSSGDVKVFAFEDLKKEDLEKSDIVITIGGDGTFVRASNLIEDSLILGINAEPHKSEGALTSLDFNEEEKLKEILLGNFDVSKRHRARVRLNGKILEEHALNEVYVGSNSQFHTSRYKIKFKGDEEEHRSSGVIISTGTGSAAWFSSAGGKIFNHDEEKLGFVVREPYFGKRVFTPKIISGHIIKGDKIILESKRHFGGIIAINESTYDFNEGDIVEVELSDKPLKVVKPKS